MIEINGFRVRQAREINQYTQEELAIKIGSTQYSIARIENDVREIEEQTIEKIAFATGFPISFFQQGMPPEFPSGSLLFRCRSNLPAGEIKRLRHLASIESQVVEKLSAKVKPLDLRLPVLSGQSPQEIAQITRATLGLSPDTPVPHLINRLERNGIFVFAIPDADKRFDAFSLWSDSEPRQAVIVINHSQVADRVRFSTAHELAHLILHKSPRGNPKDLERDANAFASEFLLPEAAMRRAIKTPVVLSELAKLKPIWGVSIQALVVRAHHLNLLNERQYRYMFEQISRFGWRKREPENLDIPKEKPRLFRKLIEMSFGIPFDIEKVAAAFHLSPNFIRELISVHAELNELPRQEEGKFHPQIKIADEIKSNVIPFKK